MSRKIGNMEYNEDGRLLGAPILISVFSPTRMYDGIDPTTGRDYAIHCPNCTGTVFYEDRSGYELKCKQCDALLGLKAVEEAIH